MDALTGRHLDVNELGKVVAPRTSERLSDAAQRTWLAEGPYAAGQPLGEDVVHFVLRLLALEGLICIVPSYSGSPFALVEEWLGGPFAPMEPESARAELLRRYLRSYGPSTRAQFAAWLGVTAGDAKAWWELLSDELTEVTVDQSDGSTRRAWILAEDAELLEQALEMPGSTSEPEVRFLPVSDPYTQCRDRGTIVAKERHRTMWKTVGSPGTLLVNGRIVGTWRPKKKGRTLTVTVEPFVPLSSGAHDVMGSEAERLGPVRGASNGELVVREV